MQRVSAHSDRCGVKNMVEALISYRFVTPEISRSHDFPLIMPASDLNF